MTVDRKETISIPKWLLLLAIPTIMGVFGGLLSSAVAKGTYQNQVNVNTKRLDNVEKDKVNVIEFEIVKDILIETKTDNKQQLNRIENKLDTHIQNGSTVKLFK